jgi:hypothetical protein
MKNEIKRLDDWLNENEREHLNNDELIKFIEDHMEKYRGSSRIGRENLTKTKHLLRERRDESGYSDPLAQRTHDLLSAYINLKLGIFQTLSTIRMELMLRDPKWSDPTWGEMDEAQRDGRRVIEEDFYEPEEDIKKEDHDGRSRRS